MDQFDEAMSTLQSNHRQQLQRVVLEAQDLCTTACRDSLVALEIDRTDPASQLSTEKQRQRDQLLEHFISLSPIDNDGSRDFDIDCLVDEYTFQLWHSMLFAYFLSGNDLLYHCEKGLVTLNECNELARSLGIYKWQLIFSLVYRTLPNTVHSSEHLMQVPIEESVYQQLESLLNSLPKTIFRTKDAVGWAYQFWQSRKKNAANRSNSKIGASQLAPVTQLFTEPYMVKFLLQNLWDTWWTQHHQNLECPIDLPYSKHRNTALAPTDLSGSLADFCILDPCCGTGHFLVETFLTLVPMRMSVEKLTASQAIDIVLKENLHGLDLDSHCVSITTFALALEAWRFPKSGGLRPLPELNMAWCGQPVFGSKLNWKKLAGDDYRLAAGMETLYEMFAGAPILGSLMEPTQLSNGDMLTAGLEELEPLIKSLFLNQSKQCKGFQFNSQNFYQLYRLLCKKYDVILTNVPYLGREKQTPKLRSFCELYYPLSKPDLATVFLERVLKLCKPSGELLIVLPQNFLFLSRYKQLRERLLDECTWKLLSLLGSRAFESISGEVVKTCLVQIQPKPPSNSQHRFLWIDASQVKTPQQKSECLKLSEGKTFSQIQQLENADSIVGYENDNSHALLEEFAYCYQGIATSDNAQFVFRFWEVERVENGWEYFQFAPSHTATVSGCSHILFWENADGKYSKHALALKKEGRLGGWKSGQSAWGKRGIAINRMDGLPVSYYFGTKFDCNVAALIPRDQDDFLAIWEYCASESYNTEVRKLNRKLSVTNSTLAKVPFNKAKWNRVALKQVDATIDAETDDPTQWLFHGHPKYSSAPFQVSVARMLGYRWPAETDSSLKLSDHASQLVDEIKATHGCEVTSGIVCFPSLCGEPSAPERLSTFLNRFLGDSWRIEFEESIFGVDDRFDLETWLRSDFFSQHCRLFHHRPFIWHIWDGLERDGFHALVNYHRLAQSSDQKYATLELLLKKYLSEWIHIQKLGVSQGDHGAEKRLNAAIRLKLRLQEILDGNPPYDIFVRWKSLNNQPQGWQPDLNDGIRVNIRPFMQTEGSDNGRKKLGILRVSPNINWSIDRGKEPMRSKEQFPWFWSGDSFTGIRVNDLHIGAVSKEKETHQ